MYIHSPFSEREFVAPINFLWLELTNRCNLSCTHCYSESHPHSGDDDKLSCAHYELALEKAFELGCRKVQFIGGEPTLNRDVGSLIEHAHNLGYEFIEIFTNLIRLPENLLNQIIKNNVHIATSVYSDSTDIHDKVTTVTGSFARTISNLKQLIASGVPVRAGVIEMDANRGTVEQVQRFLRGIGVQNVGSDRLRKFGRGKGACESDMGELCGECAGGTLCVGSDGYVSPCIMSKAWTIGSILDNPLDELINSPELANLRQQIFERAVQPHLKSESENSSTNICAPKTCAPYSTCNPKTGPGPCEPNGCTPCYPKG